MVKLMQGPKRICLLIAAVALVINIALPDATTFGAKREDRVAVILDDCGPVKPNPDSENDPGAEPADVGDLSDPTSNEYRVAKEVYDTFTDVFGTSGAFAVGVISNLKYESALIPDRAEGVGIIRFGMDSAAAPAGISGGHGGGLAQFTPYTKFTNSDYWRKIDPLGWGVQNQIAFIWGTEFASGEVWRYASSTDPAYGAASYGKTPAFGSLIGWCSTTNPALASQAFQVGYERPAIYHPEREELATQINVIFNSDNKPADMDKLTDALSGGPNTTPGIDGTRTPEELRKRNECLDARRGKIDTGLYMDLARQYADDPSIGYSQIKRFHNPDMDCSSYVWYCLTNSGAVDASTLSNGLPFTTHTAPAALRLVGFTQYPYTSAADLEEGDILWREDHMEFYNGNNQSIGAHQDTDGKDGDSNGDEICAVALVDDWTYFYRPENVGGAGQDYADAADWQKKIVDATKAVPSPPPGYCATWVTQVYRAAGYSPVPLGNANDMWKNYCNSSVMQDLRPGMIVAVQRSGPTGDSWRYGHVGIYIGDNTILHSTGIVAVDTVQSWRATYDPYGTMSWGFP